MHQQHVLAATEQGACGESSMGTWRSVTIGHTSRPSYAGAGNTAGSAELRTCGSTGCDDGHGLFTCTPLPPLRAAHTGPRPTREGGLNMDEKIFDIVWE